ncbi:hypothetical protein CHU95_15255 [Niveispirillum lacus]|uniref:Uncharacterized protein n=1 Tax=Niveispirillum lacus TaxID=1981099 RepID=A0A255YWU5_9PROT|nr:hypothetical protein [Niveispirillum lacus]OYQ33706.1 hypothetical protein CHU95_15255 [Niveispirillum lacus]
MSDPELTSNPGPATPVPAPVDPAIETSRLERIEARLAALEDRLAGAGAALPPPRDTEPPPSPAGNKGGLDAMPTILASLNDFVRNNPVLTLIAIIVGLVVLSHLFD